jgi:tetratricopeptide (TPR) repeat protein
MGFLIAFFNDLEASAQPAPGSNLTLPILEPELMSQVTNIEKELERAEILFNAQKYDATISLASKLLEYDPGNEGAARLKDASYYEMGRQLRRQGKYRESLKMFDSVDPLYKNVQKIIASVQRTMEKLAEQHYRMGVKYFVNEQLEEALGEWEIALELNPDHKKAKANIVKTKTLLEKLENVR